MATAKQIAEYLFEQGMNLPRYRRLQKKRKERLKFFEENGLETIMATERKLIAKGERVLKYLKELYKKENEKK